MKRLGLLLLFVPALAAADKTYNDSGAKIAHDCDKQGNPTFNASNLKITVTGKCEKVTIDASNNKGTIANAKHVEVNGSNNKLELDTADTLEITGSNNEINVVKVGKVEDTGSKNKVIKNLVQKVKIEKTK